MSRQTWSVAITLAGCLLAASAFADSAALIQVRVGTHPGFGRIVFDLPAHTDYSKTRDGQHIVFDFTGDVAVGAAPRMPRNVVSINNEAGRSELVLVRGATLRETRNGNHVIVDVLDPTGFLTSSAPADLPVASTAPRPPPPEPPAPVKPASPPPHQAAEPPQPQPQPVATVPPAAAGAPPPVIDKPAPSELVVSSDTPVGVAAFRRGSAAFIVFDRPLTIDLSALRDDKVLGGSTVQVLPAATMVRIPLASEAALAVTSAGNSWRIVPSSGSSAQGGIKVIASNNNLLLTATRPSASVTVTDPDTGATLLVGTQRQTGQNMPMRQRLVDFVLLPTWQGVAVQPNADSVQLRVTHEGFSVTDDGTGLALSPPSETANQLAHAAGLTRQFDFPVESTIARLQRLAREMTSDALTPALSRGVTREAVARTMISLGMGAEAQAVMQMASSDDPHLAATPDAAALASIAALLAGRPSEAGGLDDAKLPQTDEITLWRAMRGVSLQQPPVAVAARFAATLPLLLAYPPEMRDRILPQVAETMVLGGETGTAAALLDARKDDTSLDFARGLLQQVKGDSAGALAIFDRLAQSRDQSLHARAAIQAVEMRLATGALDAKQAADKLDGLLYAWRGDQRELQLRERLADLRARSGAWRGALALLRENEALFPDDKTSLHGRLTDMFTVFLRSDAANGLPPLELVSLVDENTDLLPDGSDSEALEARLADGLVKLDLPKRAGPVLEKLMQAAPTSAGRAGFGARLTTLRLREGDADGALAALAASDASDLSSEMNEQRSLLAAAAEARRGDNAKALSVLGELHTAAADEARARILERANDWPAAQQALAALVDKMVPHDGVLNDVQQRALLRLATAAARAGDAAALGTLRQQETPRMGAGPLADMFRLLTADQIHGPADLKRSGQETNLAHALPDQLKALRQPALTP